MQHDAVLDVVHQSENVETAFAEPEMLHAVKVLRRVRRTAINSVTITWDKDRGRWETRKYEGCVSVRYAFGEDYRSAMLRTAAFGSELDEPLDTQ